MCQMYRAAGGLSSTTATARSTNIQHSLAFARIQCNILRELKATDGQPPILTRRDPYLYTSSGLNVMHCASAALRVLSLDRDPSGASRLDVRRKINILPDGRPARRLRVTLIRKLWPNGFCNHHKRFAVNAISRSIRYLYCIVDMKLRAIA